MGGVWIFSGCTQNFCSNIKFMYSCGYPLLYCITVDDDDVVVVEVLVSWFSGMPRKLEETNISSKLN